MHREHGTPPSAKRSASLDPRFRHRSQSGARDAFRFGVDHSDGHDAGGGGGGGGDAAVDPVRAQRVAALHRVAQQLQQLQANVIAPLQLSGTLLSRRRRQSFV
jgi:hypothetical protein